MDGTETVDGNIFSLIQMHLLPSARSCRQLNFAPNKILQFLTGGAG